MTRARIHSAGNPGSRQNFLTMSSAVGRAHFTQFCTTPSVRSAPSIVGVGKYRQLLVVVSPPCRRRCCVTVTELAIRCLTIFACPHGMLR